MKKCLVLMLALFLTSCIDVEDFGAYWEKGVVNVKLAGRWEKITRGAKSRDEIYLYDVVVKDGTYTITPASHPDGDKEPIFARLIRIGDYDFLMSGTPPKGTLYRYKFVDGLFQLFELNTSEANKFVAEKYPDAKNIESRASDSNLGDTAFFSVKLLNEDTAKILAEIPDNEMFWQLESQYKKIR